MFKEIESLIDEMIGNVGKIRQNRETNLVAATEQKQMIESEIRELRTKVNNHLDTLQEDLMKECMFLTVYLEPFIVLVTKCSNFQNI
jgi:hypothetical protein